MEEEKVWRFWIIIWYILLPFVWLWNLIKYGYNNCYSLLKPIYIILIIWNFYLAYKLYLWG